MNFINNIALVILLLLLYSCKYQSENKHTSITIEDTKSDCYPTSNYLFNELPLHKKNKNDIDSLIIEQNIIIYGNLLSNGKQYVLLKSEIPPVSKLYYYKEESLKEILCFDRGAEFIKDSIFDINDDNQKDFVIKFRMGGNEITKVYLQKHGEDIFKQSYQFYNATFTDDIVEGYINNQSPNYLKYKFRWRGEKIDTLEWK